MRRRQFVSLLAGAAIYGPRAVLAQSSAKVFRLGTLTPGLPLDEKSPLGSILLKALEGHGYTLDKNLSFKARGAGGQVSKLGEIVRDMKADQVDVIVAVGFPVIIACKVANVPTVVAYGGGDPVATHLIDGLARPGGNITGISDNATTLSTKRLALIKQAVPKVQRVAMLWNRDDLGMSMRYEASAGCGAVDWSNGAGAGRARARRLQRCVRSHGSRTAGRPLHGGRRADFTQPQARVRLRRRAPHSGAVRI